MPYPPRQIPDAPLPMSMAPQAETLSGNDIVVIVQPLNAPGHKTRSMTLSQLASFIAAGELGEIVFVNVNGFRSTVGKDGYNYHHDADQSNNANLDYAIDSNGIHAVLATSNYVNRFEASGNKVLFSKTNTINGLTDKVEIFENYIQISHQERVNGSTINTHTSRIAWDHMRTPEVRVMQDENNYIPIRWDSTDPTNSEFVIWQRANSGTVAVPKLHVYGTLLVEKDTTIDADLAVNKTLHVTQGSTFDGTAEFNDYVISKKGLDSKGKSMFERINAGSSKSYFNVDDDVNINTLLANTSIAVSVGDIVIVHNTGDNDITITLGTRPGDGGTETKTTTLASLCAMQFICCLLPTIPGALATTQWAPLGNATVTWST